MPTENKGVKPTPFLDHAPKFWDLGLPVFPLKAGKKDPIQKGWNKLKEVPSPRQQEAWLKKYPDANLGLILGKVSGLTVVDLDDPNFSTGAAQEEFGMAGLIVRTASGKYHLYYRYNGEAREIGYLDRKLDILGDNGYVVLPPSALEYVGMYSKIEGDWFGMGVFTSIKEGALCKPFEGIFTLPEHIAKGTRNKTLFMALRYACTTAAHTYESLLAYGVEIVKGRMSEPLEIGEIRDCVKSVWGYWLAGKLVPPHTQHAVIWELPDDLEAEAYRLFVVLKKTHAGVREDFKIMPKGLAPKLKVSEKTIKKARDVLLATGLIRCIHAGGNGAGDPALYVFTRGPLLPPIQ